ncbi:hypothetical protein M2244_001254 [Rhodoferax antarcticus]|nr:hypothetical protein [Rhodoferax antarcticus]
MLAQLLVFVRQQGKPAKGVAGGQHQNQRREDALDTVRVKLGEAEIPALQASENDGRNQKARDHKEDVHADEATAQFAGKGVEHDDRENRHRPQAVDVGSVSRVGVVFLGW